MTAKPFSSHPLRALASFILCLAVVAGCGGGSSAPPVATGGVSGLVQSAATGAGLAGVTVTAGGQTATTSGTGSYSLSGVTAGSAVAVKFELAGYASSFRRVAVVADKTATAGARLTPVAATQTVTAADGGTVTVPNSAAQVTLPANGFVDKATGAVASGAVTVQLTPIDPASDAANMPGDYSARGTDGSAQTIESFGALNVELTGSAGNRLDLAAGVTATVRIPLASRSSAPPASIALYYFDEATGEWVQQGTATLGGTAPALYYEGSVGHFTSWNADRPAQTIYVHGCVKQANGSLAVDALVSTDGIDYSGSATATTDASGNFVVPIRMGGTASLYASDGSGSSNVLVVGPSQVDIYLPACVVLGPPGPPVIVDQPTPVSAQEGGVAQFRVIARGTQPLRYQWLRNGVPSTSISNDLLIYPVSGADNGAQFSVVVTNDYGSVTSDLVGLTVAVLPPGILSGPLDAAVSVGATATFSVTTTQPTSLLSFQWQRNGIAITGATGPSYTTPATTAADDGSLYRVTLTNSAGIVTSRQALLTVQAVAAPTIVQGPANASVTTGQSAVFQVVAAGSPPLSYQWQKNGTVIAGATASSYSTPATVLADNGAQFSVVVSNAVGSANAGPATLSVADATFAPAITGQPQSVTTVSGQTATFSVAASGTAPLGYQWLRNGTPIAGATSSAYTTPVLVLADNNASFTVQVSNAQGSVLSSAAVLTVTAAAVAPTITSGPQATTVVAGATATFSVTATGTSPLTFQWKRNGADIAGATSATYTTPVLSVSDSGAVFTVLVGNAIGSVVSGGATLTVTPSQAGAGRYLVAQAGPPVTTAFVFANGSQSADSQAILAAPAAQATGTAVVEAAGQATGLFGPVLAGTVSGGQVSGLHTRYELYFKAGGLYRIDHEVATGSPQGVALTTLAPSDVCALGATASPDVADQAGNDLVDPTRNWVFFAAPVSGVCASPSDRYRAVRMSMGSTDTALTVGQPVAALYDSSAAVTGYILRNGSAFQKVDANLANPTTLFTLAPSAFRSFGVSLGASAPGVWLFFNGGQLYAYDLATQAGSATVVATLQAGERVGTVLTDGADAYVSITSGSFSTPAYRIIKVSGTLTSVPVYAGTGQLAHVALTPSRIVLVSSSVGASPSTQVASVLRDGTGWLDIGGANNGFLTLLAYSSGENVYLDEAGFDATGQMSGVRTRILGSDGSNVQVLANTAIVGVTQAGSLPLVRTLSFSPYAVLLVDGVAADGTSSGGTLRSVLGSTRAPLLTYGSLQSTPAATLFPATIDPLQYGLSGLFAFTPIGASAGSSDLYFFDTASANSLTKLTGFVMAAGSTASPMVRAPGRKAATGATLRRLQRPFARPPSAPAR